MYTIYYAKYYGLMDAFKKIYDDDLKGKKFKERERKKEKIE